MNSVPWSTVMDRGTSPAPIARSSAAAQAAVHFGLLYRRHFERTKGTDDEQQKPFLLPLPEILAFAAIAALSGIIGGVAHDTVKALIRRIVRAGWEARRERQRKLTAGDIIPETFETVEFPTTMDDAQAIWPDFPDLDGEEELDFFFRYLEAFATGLRDLDTRIKSGIVEEMVVDEMSRITMSEHGMIATSDDAARLHARALESLLKRPKPSEHDYADLWKNIETLG